MKAAKLVDACTTNAEQSDLLYAVVEEVGLRGVMDALWNIHFTNGTAAEAKALRKACEEMLENLTRGEAADPWPTPSAPKQ